MHGDIMQHPLDVVDSVARLHINTTLSDLYD